MNFFRCIFAVFLISICYFYTVSITHAQSKLDTRAWIASNKKASSKEIDTFLKEEFLKKVENLKEAYASLDAIIQAYDVSVIPPSTYTIYAHFAQLSFDFTKALNMHLRAYNYTKQEKHLIHASIHALESGDLKSAFSYLEQAEKMTLSDEQRIFLKITQAKVLIQDGLADIALASLQTLPFIIGQEKLTSNFYYTLYHTAKRNGKKLEANLAHQALTEQFPYSIEVYMLNSLYVQPLPLPSQIFTLHSKIIHDNDTADIKSQNHSLKLKPTHSVSLTQNREIQNMPQSGYQVAAFTDIANAHTAFEYYYNIWSSFNSDTIKAPIITKKNVSGLRFYQIIFPFDDAIVHDSDAQHKLLKKLREYNIEGGFIITQ